jgi:terminal uridylyltransferase
VKAWAKARGINSAPQGTLNSFGYSVLVLHFLQRVEPPILPVLTSPLLQLRGRARQRALAAGLPAELSLPGHFLRSMSGVQFEYHLHAARILEGWGSDNPASVAELFASFFEYYAAFDFEQRVVPAFAPGEPLIKDEVEFYTNQGSALCLQDPLDPHDNVSRNVGTSAAERIRGELSRAHRLVCEVGLKSVLTEICQAPSKNQRRGQRKEERLRQKALEEEQNAAQS